MTVQSCDKGYITDTPDFLGGRNGQRGTDI